MGDRKSKKRGKNEVEKPTKLTKEEDAIARFIRFNCPDNSTMFEGNEVHYFSGKKAVELLVESKKYGSQAKVPKFTNDLEAEDFLQSLLERGLFFRAKKVVLKKKDKSVLDEKKKGSGSITKSPKAKHESPKLKAGKSKDKLDAKQVTDNADEEAETEGAKEDENKSNEQEKQEEEKKKKKKVKLIAHDIQTFVVDPSDVYVWIFDPTSFFKKMIGVLIIFGTIAGCLFPLWPDWLRLGIYYLSVTGIACFGVLIGLALARSILFCIIWGCTVGRHKLWVLPNLTEDCGFFESFKPFYTYEYVPGGFFGDATANKKKSKDKKKASTNTTRDDNKTTEDVSTNNSDSQNISKVEKTPLLYDEKTIKNKLKGTQKSPDNAKKKGKEKQNQFTDESEPEEQLMNEESSDQDLDEEDENHLSDELSQESDPGTSNSKTDEENAFEPSPRIRHQHKDNKKKQKKEESPATGDDDFVMVDNN